jgi:hypothetical protein
MFSSRKILKPDVPPKRYSTAPGFLRRWFRLLSFSPARPAFPVGHSAVQPASAAEQEFLERNRA